jgi:hypothetical protein
MTGQWLVENVENPGNGDLRQAIADFYTTLEAGDIRACQGQAKPS